MTKLHPKLKFGPLIKPQQIPNLVWRDSSVDQFVARLNFYGDPDNRYLTYGYTIMLDDLVKIDQIIWSIRRHCRKFHHTFENGDQIIEIDEVEDLQLQPEQWKLGGLLPIETLLEDESREHQKNVFLRLNIPFAPHMDHRLPKSGTWIAASNSPLINDFEILKSATASSEAREDSAAILSWVLANIQCGATVKREIETALLNRFLL